jgi:hypothetical protein
MLLTINELILTENMINADARAPADPAVLGNIASEALKNEA